ncbi:hypothetical protein ABBQ32_007402 [Trebouxia sp. C0010 RCD-2024]
MAQHDELAPSGQALRQAASWLGISDPVKVLDGDPAMDAFQPRPEGLGLGAKFLPHHKAAQLTMPLEKRFGKRLQRAATGDDDEGTPAAPLQKRGRPMGKYQAVDSKQQSDGSSEEQEVGRSGAFGPRKPLQQQTRATSLQQPPQKKKGKRPKANDKQQP